MSDVPLGFQRSSQHLTLQEFAMSVPKDRPQPGPGAPLTAEREQYRRLMAQGLNNHRACLQIGINPTSGMRWPKGRNMVDHTGKARVSPADPRRVRPESLDDQREICRNISGAGNYRPFGAHRKALARRPRPRSGKLAHDNDLRDFVQSKLVQRWSPQQICHALPIEFPGQTERHLVHERHL
jgi:IS30 family transposase